VDPVPDASVFAGAALPAGAAFLAIAFLASTFLATAFFATVPLISVRVVVAMSADHLGHKYLGGHAMTASTNLFKSATSANKNKNRTIETTSDLCFVKLMFDGPFLFLRRS
jgi:hypothetical protein